MAAKKRLFTDVGIVPMQGSGSGSQQALECTLAAVGNTIKVLATTAKGSIELNVSDNQDFNGTSYVTVFGRSVHNMTVACMETTNCTGKYSSQFAAIAKSLKGEVNSGKLPMVTLKYAGSSLSISGYVYRIDFELNPPFRYFILHIQGTF